MDKNKLETRVLLKFTLEIIETSALIQERAVSRTRRHRLYSNQSGKKSSSHVRIDTLASNYSIPSEVLRCKLVCSVAVGRILSDRTSHTSFFFFFLATYSFATSLSGTKPERISWMQTWKVIMQTSVN